MPTIFISYRREDAIASAGRLFDWLSRKFGPERVFLDTQSIGAGAAFPAILRERLETTDILLVVIGPKWASITDEAGQPRLANPDDFVRLEVATGLARGIRTIPVLVGGASMPKGEQLPKEVASLATLNAQQISDWHFDQDFDHLVDAILGRHRNFARRELSRLQRLLRVAQRSSLIAPGVALALLFAAWLQVFDYLDLDTKVSSYSIWLGEQFIGEAPDVPVVLVAIDDATEDRYGPYEPSGDWRIRHAELIGRLAEAGAKRVVFDLFFEKDLKGDDVMAGQILALRNRTQVTLAVRSASKGQPVLAPTLRNAAVSWGTACFIRRTGGYTPTVPLAFARRPDAQSRFPAMYPALALVAVTGPPVLLTIDTEREAVDVTLDKADLPIPIAYSVLEELRSPVRTCGILSEDYTVASLMLSVSPAGYWRDSRHRVSYVDVLELSPDALTAKFRGKIALVGKTLGRSNELHPIVRGFGIEKVYGVELQADAIVALSAGKTVRPPSVTGQWLWMVALCVAGAAASFQLYRRSRGLRLLFLGGALSLYLLLIAVLYAAWGWLLNGLYDLTAFASGYLILTRLQRRWITSNTEEGLP